MGFRGIFYNDQNIQTFDEYSGKIIVDCDTNEIFGYSNLEPFEPPEMIIKKNTEDKKKKFLKTKDKELEINNLNSNNFTQGKNLIVINKNTIYYSSIKTTSSSTVTIGNGFEGTFNL